MARISTVYAHVKRFIDRGAEQGEFTYEVHCGHCGQSIGIAWIERRRPEIGILEGWQFVDDAWRPTRHQRRRRRRLGDELRAGGLSTASRERKGRQLASPAGFERPKRVRSRDAEFEKGLAPERFLGEVTQGLPTRLECPRCEWMNLLESLDSA